MMDEDMAVGAVIAPEVIVHLTAADMHIGYHASLFVAEFEGSPVWRSSFQDEAIH